MLNNGGGGVPPGKRSLCGLGCTNLKSFHPKTGPRLPSSSSIAFVAPKMLLFGMETCSSVACCRTRSRGPAGAQPRSSQQRIPPSPPPNTTPPPSAPSPLLGGTGGPRKQRGEAAGPNVQPLLPRFNSTAPSGGGGGGKYPPGGSANTPGGGVGGQIMHGGGQNGPGGGKMARRGGK